MNFNYNQNYANAYPPNSMPQPPPNQQPQNQVPMDCNCDFIVVPGPQAVKDFVVRPNQKRYFLDANNPIMYVKSADSFGMSDTKAYRTETISFDDLIRQDAVSTFPGVQREEYDGLVSKMNQMEETLRQFMSRMDNNGNANKGGNKYESSGNKSNNKR